MTSDKRLNRVFPELTAKERALLILRAMKAGADEDPWVRATIPYRQAAEFNRLIEIINTMNTEMGWALHLIREQVTHVELRHAWLVTVHVAGVEQKALRTFVAMGLREPVTESEYRERLASAREEYVPLDECAEIAAEERAGADATDAGWESTWRACRAELRKLASQGEIASKGRGARLRLQQGAFYDWLGETIPLVPEWGGDIEVLPDDRSDEVERRRRDYEWLRENIDGTPMRFAVPLDTDHPVDACVEPTREGGDRLAHALLFAILRDIRIHWAELRAIEIVAGESADEFDGEDVFVPDLRRTLDEAKARLKAAAEEVGPYVASVETPEPDDDAVALVRRLLHR
jgi:hypothetical protein